MHSVGREWTRSQEATFVGKVWLAKEGLSNAFRMAQNQFELLMLSAPLEYASIPVCVFFHLAKDALV